jgi:hypothetical protein
MEGYITGRRKRGRPKRRWVQDITDELQMRALDAEHLAYDQAVFRRIVKGAKIRQGHATERMNINSVSHKMSVRDVGLVDSIS